MKCLATSLVLMLSCPVACLAQCPSDTACQEGMQGSPPFRLRAQNDTYVQPHPVITPAQPQSQQQYTSYGTEAPQTNSRWRVLGRGLARAARVAVAATAVTAAEALRAYGQYTSYQSGYASTYTFPSGSAPIHDSCSHGYTAETCPYGYNGNSYGSSYLSGDSSVRTRPDGYGNYRYYMSDGRSGRITRSYTGGYRLTTDDGDSITASASGLRTMGYRISDEPSW